MTDNFYALDLSAIRMGDIILASEQVILKNLAKKGKSFEIGHVLFCTDYGLFIHALPNGDVKTISARNMLFRSMEDVKAIRYTEKLSNPTIQLICDYARSQVGKKYSSSFPSMNSKKTNGKLNREYCSKLVAESYAYAGVNILENLKEISVERILTSPLLKEIGGIARLASHEEVEISNLPDPAVEQAKIISRMFENIRKETKCNISTFEELNNFIISNKKHDEAIAKIVNESGYLDMWKGDVSRNEWKYDIKALFALRLDPDLLAYLCDSELSQSQIHLDGYSKMMNHYNKMAEDYKIDYAKVMADLCKKLVSFMELKRRTFRMAQSHVRLK